MRKCGASGRASRRSRLASTSRPSAASSGPTDGSGGVEVAAAGQDPERGEHPPRLRRQQLLAPADRAAERALARRRIAATADEERERLVEPADELRGRVSAHARGRQLDRQREAIQTAAELGDGTVVDEGGIDRERTVDEQRDRVVGCERWHLEHPLTAGLERHPARGEHGDTACLRHERGHFREAAATCSRLSSTSSIRLSRSRSSSGPPSGTPRTTRDRRQTSEGSRNGVQVDEEDAVAELVDDRGQRPRAPGSSCRPRPGRAP
jgi:hypothetical protein